MIHIHEDIWAAAIQEVLGCSREQTNVGNFFAVKLFSRRIFCYILVHFLCMKIFYNEKSELRYTASHKYNHQFCFKYRHQREVAVKVLEKVTTETRNMLSRKHIESLLFFKLPIIQEEKVP